MSVIEICMCLLTLLAVVWSLALLVPEDQGESRLERFIRALEKKAKIREDEIPSVNLHRMILEERDKITRERNRLLAALAFIAGHSDAEPWLSIYNRVAKGGKEDYAGLRAVADEAINSR